MANSNASVAGRGSKPNIILIMADDMGYSDIGCFGSEIATPNLDSLAASGGRFSQFYNYARCCPTRAALLTGLAPHEAGIGHMTLDLGSAPYQGYLNDNCVTIAEALKGSGYSTYMSGKWHAGGDYPYINWRETANIGGEGYPTPRQRGFDRFYGILAGSANYFDPHTLMSDDELIDIDYPNYFFTDAIADSAAGFVDGHMGENPYLLYLSFTAPHWPLHAVEEDIERYRGRYLGGWDELRKSRHERLNGMGVLSDTWEISPRDRAAPAWEDVADKDWEDARMAVYAAQVDRMDQGIGRVLDAVRRSGQWNNTLIMFISDNGGCAEYLAEDGIRHTASDKTRDGRDIQVANVPGLIPGPETTYMSYDLPWANASCAPFRYYKHFTHEGGIGTPFVCHWPDVIEPGSIGHQPAYVVDFMATFLDAAGGQYPTEYAGREIRPVRGESFLPAFSGQDIGRQRPLIWEHEANRAVRDGNWKLVNRHPGAWELYDIDTDRTELHDLAAANAPVRDRLVAAYEEWANEVGVGDWDKLIASPAAARFRSWIEAEAEG